MAASCGLGFHVNDTEYQAVYWSLTYMNVNQWYRLTNWFHLDSLLV